MNQQSFRKPHLCFSGNLSCSGCAPCDACLEKVRTYVLPMAMSNAGFAGSPEQARAFFESYNRLGWPRLQEAMLREAHVPGPAGDPGLRGQYLITDIAAIIAELEMYRAEARTRMAMNMSANMPPPAPPSEPAQQHFPMPDYGAPPPNPFAPTLNGADPHRTNGQHLTSEVEEASPLIPIPIPVGPALTVEDIASAAIPARMEPVMEPVMSPERVSLGNVMTVPPGMEHHLTPEEKS